MILSSNHQKFQKEIRELAQSTIAPRATEYDATGKFVEENIRILAAAGYLGIPWPKELGGMGLDYLSYAIAVEEVSRACAATGLTLAAHTSLGTYPIYKFGTEDQKKKYIPPLARGEYLGAFGLTEPNAGSDAASIETSARKTEKGYIINGSKRFITNAAFAGTIVVAATLDRKLGRKGITCFIVETKSRGFIVAKEENKMGLRGSNTVELAFEDLFVPEENVLGKEYDGYRIFMETLDGGRISIGAFCLGMAQSALDVLINWAKTRELSQQAAKALADTAMEVEAARLLVYDAALIKDAGVRADKQCAFAKLFASEVAMRAVNTAIATIGMPALTQEMDLNRVYRDAKLGEIGEGTSEIMRLIIAKEVLKEA
ncbi:MAG: acyl-CoA dehydrogenase family protein [candidate division WOR-3 bacterium]|nr:acyl-CoA dehydrogenase family protein [candidate division WOR-3 bacterium]MCR4423385.1 acyl-CoA dehydrogenase family protein [candidate division WOR-3 bacterium]MDH7518724.1 acyl-CoA dehydrogenase family protein [bacterium]